MSYWSEIKNDFIETDISPQDGDVISINHIDAWREGEEEGATIARVMLSKRGDVLVDYIDAIARHDALAQEVIADSRSKMSEDFKARQNQQEPVVEPMINIDLGFGKLQAIRGGDPSHNEIVVLLEDAKTGLEQPLAVIGQKFHYDKDTDYVCDEVVQDKGITVRVWTDKDSDDVTHFLSIDVCERESLLESEFQVKTSLLDQIKSAESRTGTTENLKGVEPER